MDIRSQRNDFEMLKTIWSSAKCMHLLTLSQVLHYKLDCDQLDLAPTELKFEGFKIYIESFLRPFQIKIDQKNVRVEYKFSYGGLECDEVSTQMTKAQICTDFRVYNCILFNLLSNAINHCPRNSKITIKISFEEFD